MNFEQLSIFSHPIHHFEHIPGKILRFYLVYKGDKQLKRLHKTLKLNRIPYPGTEILNKYAFNYCTTFKTDYL